MTREEAAKICQSIKFILDSDDYSEEVEEALNMAIEALQQEPKRGKWIDTEETQDYIKVKHRICSVCYREPSAWSSRKKFKYCPNCGARME